MITTDFNSFVPKTKSTTVTIKDVYYTLLKNKVYYFNPSFMFVSYNPETIYHNVINEKKTFKEFLSFGLPKRLDIIHNYTKRGLQNNQLYVLELIDNDLFCSVIYAKRVKQ